MDGESAKFTVKNGQQRRRRRYTFKQQKIKQTNSVLAEAYKRTTGAIGRGKRQEWQRMEEVLSHTLSMLLWPRLTI